MVFVDLHDRFKLIMRKTYLLPLGFIVTLLAGFYFFSNQSAPEISYAAQLDGIRLERDYMMRNDANSPFRDSLHLFSPLQYFEANPALKITARFEPIMTINTVKIPTYNGDLLDYISYGYLHFEYNGTPQRLTIYSSVTDGKQDLFLGFRDQTNGQATYGGGRYINLKHQGETEVTLDFNLAYNPYCAYNEAFICPVPPRENTLDFEVNAGEKAFHLK